MLPVAHDTHHCLLKPNQITRGVILPPIDPIPDLFHEAGTNF